MATGGNIKGIEGNFLKFYFLYKNKFIIMKILLLKILGY